MARHQHQALQQTFENSYAGLKPTEGSAQHALLVQTFSMMQT